MVKRVCLVSSGTGGHLLPAVVLAQALREASKVHRSPSDAAALLVRARAYTELGDLPRADAAWRAALRRAPNDWKLQLEWFRALVRLGGDRQHALRVYARARELNPRLPAPG